MTPELREELGRELHDRVRSFLGVRWDELTLPQQDRYRAAAEAIYQRGYADAQRMTEPTGPVRRTEWRPWGLNAWQLCEWTEDSQRGKSVDYQAACVESYQNDPNDFWWATVHGTGAKKRCDTLEEAQAWCETETAAEAARRAEVAR